MAEAPIKAQQWEDIFGRLQIQNFSGGRIPLDNWHFEFSWQDAKGNEISDYHYAGDRMWHRGELSPTLNTQRIANTGIPVGFQKNTGKFRVAVTLVIEGHGRATSNYIDVQVIPNPALSL